MKQGKEFIAAIYGTTSNEIEISSSTAAQQMLQNGLRNSGVHDPMNNDMHNRVTNIILGT